MPRIQRVHRIAFDWPNVACVVATVALAACPALAQDGGGPGRSDAPIDVAAPAPMASVTLATGDTLRCRVLQMSEDTIVLEHAILGRMYLARESVTAVNPLADAGTPPLPPGPTNPAAGKGSAEANEDQAKADSVKKEGEGSDVVGPAAAAPTGAVGSPLDLLTSPYEKSFWVGWVRSVDLGINGSSGNSDTFNGRVALNLSRKTARMETTTGAMYLYQRDNQGVTKDRGEANLRNDWLLTNSPWRVWAQGKGEYDADADWTARVSGAAGLGYELIQTTDTTLVARVGLGASREFGGTANDTVPEGVLGADFTHKINDRNSLFANVDYFPDLSEFGEFRTVSKAGWETIVDPQTKLNLKLGIEHRYDSDPGDAEASEIDYFVTLGWQF